MRELDKEYRRKAKLAKHAYTDKVEETFKAGNTIDCREVVEYNDGYEK